MTLENNYTLFSFDFLHHCHPDYDEMNPDRRVEVRDVLEEQKRSALDSDPNVNTTDLDSRINYLEEKIRETSFIEGGGGEQLPDLTTTTPSPHLQLTHVVGDFIKQTYGETVVTETATDAFMELRNNSTVTENGNLSFKRIGARGRRLGSQIVLKRNGDELVYNDAKVAREAVAQFKELIESVVEEGRSHVETRNEMPMIEIRRQASNLSGLSDAENREQEGVVNPPATIDKTTREQYLDIQIVHLESKLKKASIEVERADKGGDVLEFTDAKEREVGLREALKQTREQKELENVREKQEEDVNRLERLKRYMKRNALGISAIAITIGGIITTVVIGMRKALVKGAQATSKFAKAVLDIGKKLMPLLLPILNIVVAALGWLSKGLQFLAQNLWLLAIAGAYLVYNEYKQRQR